MKTIAIVNQKGGVGKTVTAVNLTVGLAKEGKKIIAIDLDAQGSLTVSLGYNEGILHHEEGIDLLPANIELSAMEVTLVNTMRQ